MKSRRILAAVLAPVCALSATAVVANATDDAKINKVEEATEQTVSEYGTINVVQYNAGEVSFAADDVIVATVTAPEGTDTSAWRVVVNGFDNSWASNWTGVVSEAGTLTLTTTIADVMEVDGVDDVTKLGICLQVQNVGEKDDKVTVGYELSVTAAPAGDDTSSDDTSSDETPAGDDTSSDDTTSDDNTPAGDDNTPAGDDDTPGASDKAPVVIEADIKGVGTDGIEGEALEALVLVKDGKKYTWAQVEEVTFESTGLFSVQFAADADKAGTDWFTLGKDAVPSATADAPAARADEDDLQWNTEWTLDAETISLFAAKPNVKLVAKEAGTDINVKVTLKADAVGTDVENSGGDNNQPTGIALALAPAVLAGAFVAVAAVSSKKRK